MLQKLNTKQQELLEVQRKNYKQYAAIIREKWKQNQIPELLDAVAMICDAIERQKEPWDYWTFYEKKQALGQGLLERNQFAMLVNICKSWKSYKKAKNQFYLILNRYKKSNENRKKLYKDD